MNVYLLYHSYSLESTNETKMLGVYSSEKEAQLAIQRFQLKPGFKERKDDFLIQQYELNVDHWKDGYATLTTIQVKNDYNEWISTTAECLADGTYKIIEEYNAQLGEFKHLDIVKGEFIDGELYATELLRR